MIGLEYFKPYLTLPHMQVAEREKVREERHRERVRQQRIAAAAPDKRAKLMVRI